MFTTPPDAQLGLGLVATALLVAATARLLRREQAPSDRLFAVGLAMSAVGSVGYLTAIGAVYGGGDYLAYFTAGTDFAADWSEAGWAAALDGLAQMPGGRSWWGTRFVALVTGLLVAVIGPTLPGVFLVFGALGFLGCWAFWRAACRAFPGAHTDAYLGWLVLLPSLWFWTGALGKDALVLFGAGLATLGFVGTDRRAVRWLPLAVGVALVFAIRPQVAATLGFALVAGHWVGTLRNGGLRLGQGALLVGAGVAVAVLAGGALGVDLFSGADRAAYLQAVAASSNIGGSAIGGGDATLAPWLAAVTTLFRPFLWEASGAAALAAALEVVVLWGALAWRRREMLAFVRAYGRTRLFWAGAVFVVVYATALGLSVSNFGIIVRQRVHVYPFLLLFLAGAPAAPAPARVARPVAARPVAFSR